LANLLEKYPEFKERSLYVTGESYAGHYIPAISAYLHQQQNSAINLKGFAIGNGWTDPYLQYPAYNTFAYENNLISEV
jgi:cathepsin A (carboxypeptidase C)